MLLFLRELNMAKKSFIIWTVCIAGLMFLSLSMFPSFSQGMSINDMLKQFPEDVLKGLGMMELDLTQPMDYFVYLFPYVALASVIWAMLMGANMLGKEEGDGTIEFLYAKPITRDYIFFSKLCAVLSEIVLFAVLFYGINAAGFALFAEGVYDAGLLSLLTVAIVLLMLVFMGLGFLLSVFVVKARKVMPVVLGAGLGLYFLSIIANVKDDWLWLKYLIPYQYYDPIKILHEGKLDAVYTALSVGIIAVSLVSAWVIYRRKDILV